MRNHVRILTPYDEGRGFLLGLTGISWRHIYHFGLLIF